MRGWAALGVLLGATVAEAVVGLACGRSGYDAVAGDGDASTPTVDAAVIEPGTRIDVEVAPPGDSVRELRAVWTGSEFGIAWTVRLAGESQGVMFATVAPDGTINTAPTQVMSSGGDDGGGGFALTWNGTNYGMAWTDGSENREDVFFALFDSTGVKISGDTQVTSHNFRTRDVALDYSAGRFCLAWRDGRDTNDEIYFNWLDDSAAIQGTDTRVSTSATVNSSSPDIVCDANGFDLFWDAGSDVLFRSFDASQSPRTAQVDLGDTGGFAAAPSAALTGGDPVATWSDGATGSTDVYFARVDTAGNLVTSPLAVVAASGDSDAPSVISAGGSLALSWRDTRDGNDEIYFETLDPNGDSDGTQTRITDDLDASRDAIALFTGSAFAIVYTSQASGENESIQLTEFTP